ncbi:hypothetical protein CVT24_001878 [Panaeolus cyanescens]|uniref:Uncharacterized protein n=1 Tax=Panaeolus cyanescens TaxID=181874 RepID=A0A409YEQ8_9AGAR|nr:hypothetical protein CVT24_001878 [Panaeolus cyanescens]
MPPQSGSTTEPLAESEEVKLTAQMIESDPDTDDDCYEEERDDPRYPKASDFDSDMIPIFPYVAGIRLTEDEWWGMIYPECPRQQRNHDKFRLKLEAKILSSQVHQTYLSTQPTAIHTQIQMPQNEDSNMLTERKEHNIRNSDVNNNLEPTEEELRFPKTLELDPNVIPDLPYAAGIRLPSREWWKMIDPDCPWRERHHYVFDLKLLEKVINIGKVDDVKDNLEPTEEELRFPKTLELDPNVIPDLPYAAGIRLPSDEWWNMIDPGRPWRERHHYVFDRKLLERVRDIGKLE